MRRFLFVITLGLYAFSALELHEWLHVPQVVVHFLEEHTSETFHDLFHEDHTVAHEHDEHDHDPFDEDCHGEFCACSGFVALSPVHDRLRISPVPFATEMGGDVLNVAPCGFAGNVWNPPKA